MGRFLFYLSYIGTRYRGIQAQYINHKPILDVRTIQGSMMYLHLGINAAARNDKGYLKRTMRLEDQVHSSVSSRTDSGVHALVNTITMDFPDRRKNGDPHDLIMLQKVMNMNLRKNGHEIRVHKILQVDDNFVAFRKPFRRSYVYRLGIVRDAAITLKHLPIPVIELQYAYIIYPPFNMDKLLQAAEIMCGTHNFTSFTTGKSLMERNLNGVLKNPVKTVCLSVKRSAPFIGDLNKDMQDIVEFWEVHVTSKSYLYKQIRKMVNALVEVGSERCGLEDLKRTLGDPHNYKNQRLMGTLPAQGLFLKDVEYHPHDLVYRGPLKDRRKEYKKLSQTLDRYLTINSNGELGKNKSEEFTNLKIENNGVKKGILGEVNVVESESRNSNHGQITLSKSEMCCSVSRKQCVKEQSMDSQEIIKGENSQMDKVTHDQDERDEIKECTTSTDNKTQQKPDTFKNINKVSYFF